MFTCCIVTNQNMYAKTEQKEVVIKTNVMIKKSKK